MYITDQATRHLDLLTGRRTPPVLFQLLLDEPDAEAESQHHGPVPRGPAAKASPKGGRLKLSCQAPQGGAVVAVARRQESPRLIAADRRAYTEAVSSEPRGDSAGRFEETQLEGRAAQLEPATNDVSY